MKSLRQVSLFISLGMMVAPMYVCADSISYDAQTERVVYFADTEDKLASAVSYDNKTQSVYVYFEEVDSNGKEFSDTFRMTEDAPSGLYTVSLKSDSGENKLLFRHINKQQAAPAVAAINGAPDTAILGIIGQNIEDLGIDGDLFTQYADSISGYFLQLKPDNMTVAEFWNSYHQALLLSTLKNENNNEVIEGAILENAGILGIDASEFSAYADAAKKEIFARFASGVTGTGNFVDTVREWIALARLNSAQTVNEYQSLLLAEYSNVFNNLNLSDYSNSNKKEVIIGTVMANKYTTAEQLCEAFNRAILTAGTQTGPIRDPGYKGGGTGSSGTTVSIPVTLPSEKKLEDISGHWAEQIITKLYNDGIVSGSDGKFNPDENITRAQMCSMIVLAFYKGQTGDVDVFTDITSDKWYYPYVGLLYNKQIVSGMGGGIFAPDDMITRQDMAVMMLKTMKDTDISIEAQKEMFSFADMSDIASYSQEAVEKLYRAGIISGMPDGTFMPRKNLSRAEAAAVVYNVLNR